MEVTTKHWVLLLALIGALSWVLGCEETGTGDDDDAADDDASDDDTGDDDTGDDDTGDDDTGDDDTAEEFCPHVVLDSVTDAVHEGDTTGLPDLATSPRLEWGDAPDDTLLFTAPEAGSYRLVTDVDPSSNGGCGASVRDYEEDTLYDESWCPNPGATVELDGLYSGVHELAAGQTVMIFFSCTEWADIQSGPYTVSFGRI